METFTDLDDFINNGLDEYGFSALAWFRDGGHGNWTANFTIDNKEYNFYYWQHETQAWFRACIYQGESNLDDFNSHYCDTDDESHNYCKNSLHNRLIDILGE